MARNYVVLDTETTSTVRSKYPIPSKSRVYDLGYQVIDGYSGLPLEERSLIISDIFYNNDLMDTAYYVDKLPAYREGIGTKWVPVSMLDAYTMIREDMRRHDVRTIWAYNARFDLAALNATTKACSNGFRSFFFPANVKVRDIWDYASCITASPKYLRHVEEHNLFTSKGNPKTDAETVYRFVSGDTSFEERHTALEDCRIEGAILLAAKRKHCHKRSTMGQGWRDAANAYHRG